MLIIGCDFHTRYQQIAMARKETAELVMERRLDHESGEAQAFDRNLPGGGLPFAVLLFAKGGPLFSFLGFANERRGPRVPRIDGYQPLAAVVGAPTAPRPVAGMGDEVLSDRIGVHVVKFFEHLCPGVDVEIVIAALPETAQ